jgi:hypothetical protein
LEEKCEDLITVACGPGEKEEINNRACTMIPFGRKLFMAGDLVSDLMEMLAV